MEEFQKVLKNVSVSFFNTEELPKNESEGDAFKLCKSIEGAKKYCPNRWKAMESWFSFARKVGRNGWITSQTEPYLESFFDIRHRDIS